MYRLGGCFWGYAGLKPSPTEKQPRLVINSNKDVRSEPWPLVDRVRGKLNCRPYREGGEGNPKRLVEAASLAFSNRSIFLTIRASASTCDELPFRSTVFNLPSAKNPSERPSGDQKGKIAFS